MSPAQRPATIGDLDALEHRIDGKLDAMEARIDGKFGATEARLIETMRDMQTDILRGFAAYSGAQDIRLRKLEVDHSNFDTAVSGRMLILEKRLREIEKRLGITYLPEPPVS